MTRDLYHRFRHPAAMPERLGSKVQELKINDFVQYSLDAANIAQFQVRLVAAGLTLPDPGRVAEHDSRQVLAIGPQRYWVVQADGRPGNSLIPSLGFSDHATDLSGSRLFLHLGGAQAATSLARLAPFDFGLRRFPIGRVVDTIADGIPLTIWRLRDPGGFCIAVPLSYAAAIAYYL